MLSKEVDACVAELLKELVRFQDRMYQKDPVKAKTKRRLVLGLREVLKHLKLRRLKCVVISPNCEKIQSKGNGPAAGAAAFSSRGLRAVFAGFPGPPSALRSEAARPPCVPAPGAGRGDTVPLSRRGGGPPELPQRGLCTGSGAVRFAFPCLVRALCPTPTGGLCFVGHSGLVR